MNRLFRNLSAAISGGATALGFVGALAPVPQPDSKFSFLVFCCRTFWLELVAVGIVGLVCVAFVTLDRAAYLKDWFRAIFTRLGRANAFATTTEKIVSLSLLALAAMLAGLLMLAFARVPALRTYYYVNSGHFMRDYRVELLIQAFASEVRGDNEEAVALLGQFAKLFPDRVDANDILQVRDRLMRQLEVASVFSSRADMLTRTSGTTRAVLALRLDALRLSPNRKEYYAKLNEVIARQAKLLESAQLFLSYCGKSTVTEKLLGETLVAIGFDQPELLVGRGALRDRSARLCAAMAGWSEVDLNNYIERVWGMDVVKRALERLSPEAREARAREYIARARPQVREERTVVSSYDPPREVWPAKESLTFLDPARLGSDDDLARSVYRFGHADGAETVCWYERPGGYVGLRLKKEKFGTSIGPDNWCVSDERRQTASVDISRTPREREEYLTKLLPLVRSLSNAEPSSARDEALKRVCRLSTILDVNQSARKQLGSCLSLPL